MNDFERSKLRDPFPFVVCLMGMGTTLLRIGFDDLEQATTSAGAAAGMGVGKGARFLIYKAESDELFEVVGVNSLRPYDPPEDAPPEDNP